MSDHLAIERTSIYNMFFEAAEAVEIEVDSEEVWFLEAEDEDEVGHTIKKIVSLYEAGHIDNEYETIKLIAAIAFCDAADIEALDYHGTGGELCDD